MSRQTMMSTLPAGQSDRDWRRLFTLENRFIPPIFITLILLVGNLSFGILESYTKTLLAIGSAIAAELILGRVVTGKWPHLASAYITGISVGILIRSPAFWPYALCSVIAITSKYVVRVKGRIFSIPPTSEFAGCFFFAAESVAMLSIQWGN